MLTFLEETIQDLKDKYENLSDLIIILPSKRAGGFFRNYLRKLIDKPIFLPEILSIEEFIERIADLRIISNTDLLLTSYNSYLEAFENLEPDNFNEYLGWAQTLLNDLNEMDRHLVDQSQFFDYLESIKAMEHWSGGTPPSEMMLNYLEFWKRLPYFYESLTERLSNQGVGYQGMVYRRASEELEHYLAAKGRQPHIFIGFNALNKAEQVLLKGILEYGHSRIYWDADRSFFERPGHSASKFMRSYFSSWKYHLEHPPRMASMFEQPKEIEVVQSRGMIGQAKYIGQILSGLSEEQLSNTAVVLADESLLNPLLYSLPPNLNRVNVTMGVGIRNLPVSRLFTNLLRIHQQNNNVLYYKDIISILNHPVIAQLYSNGSNVIATINNENRTYSALRDLITMDPKGEKILRLLFGQWGDSAAVVVAHCLEIIELLKDNLRMQDPEIAALYEIYQIFSSMREHLDNSELKADGKTVKTLFLTAIQDASVDYQGDAYNGLQIMGVLESRVLDFENVIIASVNEGILPSGKSNASYITNDMKYQFELPGYLEKDSIYAFHFYHMLQRASKVWLLYDNSSESFGSNEKSRFILQLEQQGLPQHKLIHKAITSAVSTPEDQLREIDKTEGVMIRIKEIAEQGFSPSALGMYVRNPYEFYLRRVLRISETSLVEETVDYSTLGTVVHEALEILYRPLIGKVLDVVSLQKAKQQIHDEVVAQFAKTFKKGDYSTGKNLLIFEVSKRYIENLIDYDIETVKAGSTLEILKLEAELLVPLSISALPFDVKLKGTVDRMDRLNGELRIIDYKTGSVKPNDLTIYDWDLLATDKKYEKAMQVLAYGYMIHTSGGNVVDKAGIISLKKMKNGFMPFGIKSSPKGTPNYQLSPEIFKTFEEHLHNLIIEICNPNIPFVEKED